LVREKTTCESSTVLYHVFAAITFQSHIIKFEKETSDIAIYGNYDT